MHLKNWLRLYLLISSLFANRGSINSAHSGLIILNSVRNKKVYTSSVLSKGKNTDYIISLLDKEKPLFYYGKEDEFITQIKENGFKVDKLNTRLNINYLCPNKIVDTFDNKHLVNIGVVI